MPKKLTGSRSLRRKGALLEYARRETVTLTTPIVVNETIDCQPPLPEIEAPSVEPDAKASVQELQKLIVDNTVRSMPSTAAVAPPDADAPPPSQAQKKLFGPYELFFEINKDALSTTYVAKNPLLDGFVSLRLFNERITDSSQVRSIQKAALKAAELTHASHVCIYESGLGENNTPYVVSEWVEGESLATIFQNKKRLDIASFLNIFNQVGEVLAEAHSRQLIHGNLSPQKIILATNEIENDNVKVIDFGMPVDPVQNAFYMAPEQCLDKSRVDERSDIYSLGCIMYESLVGRPPALGSQSIASAVDFLHELANQYDKNSKEHNALKLLDCIIKRCINKKSAKRFGSVRELLSALNMVAGCLQHQGHRRLPRKAEQLLLFRFLDMFDKKIAAAMSAYLLLGLFATKYIGELQLEKYIDEAQIAGLTDPKLAQNRWRSAVQEAEKLNKPPSLQAELHWSLADSYFRGGKPGSQRSDNEETLKAAVGEYEKAYEYYKHGSHHHADAMALLNNISWLWYGMADRTPAQRQLILQKLVHLEGQKKYKETAALAKTYLDKTFDFPIAQLYAEANSQIGRTLPPEESIKYFARASAYLAQRDGRFDPYSDKVAQTFEKLGLVGEFGETRLAFAADALKRGDRAEALGYLHYTNNCLEPYLLLLQYETLRSDTYAHKVKAEAQSKAIAALNCQLKALENFTSKSDNQLSPVLAALAVCYRESGDKKKAIEVLERLLKMKADQSENTDQLVLAYVDLLAASGRNKEVPGVLERHLLLNDGTYDRVNPLIIRLFEAYSDLHMKKKAELLLKELGITAKAIKYDPNYHIVKIDGKPAGSGKFRPFYEPPRIIHRLERDPFTSQAESSTDPGKDAGNQNPADAQF